ncbi:MAG: DUF481 domain-containing protein [Acidobacteriota bacterium]|nr:DUF481 domain-containing protein [Acidobacteriota bacterium]
MKRALLTICLSLTIGLAGVTLLAAPAAAQGETPARVTLVLTDGTHLVGTVTKQEGDKVYFKSDALGDLVLDKKSIASVGAAQVPTTAGGTSATAVNPTAGTEAAAKWSGTINASYAFISGLAPTLGSANSNSVQASGFVERSTRKDAIAVISSYTLQKTDGAASDTANDFQVTAAYNRPLSSRFAFLSRNTVDMNRVLQYKYSFTTLDGLAFMPVAQKKVKLTVAPGVAYTHSEFEDTGIIAQTLRTLNFNGMGIGAYETLLIQFNPAMSLSQSQIYIYTPSSGRNQESGSIKLLGMVSPRVGLSIGFDYQYDDILPSPPLTNFYRTFTSGIQFKF